MEPLKAGQRLVTICPIRISEDEEWSEGIDVYVVTASKCENPNFGPWDYEIQADDGSIGSFNSVDVLGEHAWFRLPEGEGAPPYDAATATGMYDHDDAN